MNFTPFGQKRKTLYKRNVLGKFFGPESSKCEMSTFEGKEVKMCTIFTSDALLAPKPLQNGKVGPKVKKALLGVLGSRNVPRCLCFSLFGAWGGKHYLLLFAHFCDFPLFGRKSSFWRQQVAKPPKTLKIRPSAPFCENGIQNTFKSIV